MTGNAQQPNYLAQNYGHNNYVHTPRAASQFELQNHNYYAHNPYGVANSVGLPAYPAPVILPPPPPYPPNNTSGTSIGTITASTGNVGQAFGNFPLNA